MSASAPDGNAGDTRPRDDDEIDLRHYVGVLARWWREIALVTVLVPLVVVGVGTLMRSNDIVTFTAFADAVIMRVTSNIELDERISTTTNTAQGDANVWRNSLLAHATADDIARSVVAQLGDALPEAMRSPAVLRSAVVAAVAANEGERTTSNIIRIGATTADPELAALIADTWAIAFVDYVNNLYGEVPAATLRSVEDERMRMRAAYDAAQAAYEAFLAGNRIDELQRQISAKENLRTTLLNQAIGLANNVIVTDTQNRLAIYGALVHIPVESQANAVRFQRVDNDARFLRVLEERREIEGFLLRARAMENSLLAGNEATAATNVLALQLLKIEVFARSSSLDPSGESRVGVSIAGVQPTALSREAQLADVQGLIAALEASQTELDSRIAEGLQSQIGTPDLGVLDGLVRLDENGQPVLVQPATAAYTASLQAAYAALIAPSDTLLELPLIAQGGLDGETEAILAQLETEIRVQRAELAAEQARELDMTRMRDLAWSSYDAMLSKAQELNILRASSNSEVRLGSRALAPLDPDPQASLLLPVAAAGVAAFLLAVFMALVLDAMGREPWLARGRQRKLQST